MKRATAYIFQILILLVSSFLQNPLLAQSTVVIISAESEFNLKKARMEILSNLRPLTAEQSELLEQSLAYAKDGDFDIASVLLDELIAQLLNLNSIGTTIDPVNNDPGDIGRFEFSLISGIDFNRQEFELGYSQSDSTVLEEINRPYIGLNGEYQYAGITLHNSVRFDNENLRDDYQLRYTSNSGNSYSYGGYVNADRSADNTSYHEQDVLGRINIWRTDRTSLILNEVFAFKDYANENTTFNDFYRNHTELIFSTRAASGLGWRTTIFNELNETLGKDNNDYSHFNIRTGLNRVQYESLSYSVDMTAALRNYKIEFEDSIITNRYNQAELNATLEFPFSGRWFFKAEEEFTIKRYHTPSILEPDYTWILFRPAIKFKIDGQTDLSFGYEHESKKHTRIVSDAGNSDEQDYTSNGMILAVNYFNIAGAFVSADISYQWRRYPVSVTNDILSLYSDRNIFTVFAAANLPISTKWSINLFATYDNDLDIDEDQQNSQSSIFTAELQYHF